MTEEISLPQSTSLWKHPDFLKFWAGQTISVFGSAITGLAMPLTAVVALQASPAQMGFLNAAGMLPFLLVGLFAGAFIDRSRRRPIMLLADLGRALLLGLIPLGMFAGILRIEFLYVIEFLVGVLTVFFDVSYQAFLPALVSREKLVDGNSKMEISFSAAQIAGPGMAGGLIQLLTAPYAIALDAASFVVSAFSLSIIRTREPEPEPRTEQANIWKEIGEGLRVVLGNRVLWSIAGCTGTSNFFNAIWGSIFVLYMTRDLGLTPAQIGLIFAMGAPGALLSSLVSPRIVKRVGLGTAIIGSMFMIGISELLVLLAGRNLWVTIACLVVSGLLIGFFNVMYNVNQVSLRQTITPDRLLGRMNASMRFLVWGTIPLGAFASSALSTWLGVYPTLLIGILGGTLAFLWVLLSPVRKLKEQPQAAE